MTKSWEKGENEFTRAAKRLAMRTGESVPVILDRWLAEAKLDKDTGRCETLARALKFASRHYKEKKRGRR